MTNNHNHRYYHDHLYKHFLRRHIKGYSPLPTTTFWMVLSFNHKQRNQSNKKITNQIKFEIRICKHLGCVPKSTHATDDQLTAVTAESAFRFY